MIGSFGEVIFEVSSRKVRTFNNFSRSGSGRWSEHEIILEKPLSEFLGPGQEEIRFNIRLDASQGINPGEELKKLREMRDSGEVAVLVIGGEPVTENFWALRSLREQHRVFSGNGQLVVANAELTLREYNVERWAWWLYTISGQN